MRSTMTYITSLGRGLPRVTHFLSLTSVLALAVILLSLSLAERLGSHADSREVSPDRRFGSLVPVFVQPSGGTKNDLYLERLVSHRDFLHRILECEEPRCQELRSSLNQRYAGLLDSLDKAIELLKPIKIGKNEKHRSTQK